MATSGNGSRPHRTTEEVAAELRQQLERRLGRERTEAIWRDPTSVQQVVQGEEEAADVAETFLRALNDLPADEPTGRPRRRSAFRSGLRLALIAAVAVWALSILSKVREGQQDE